MVDNEQPQQHDSLAKWAWLAAIAPAMLAAMHMHGETDPMRRWVQHLAELSGGHNEPDWANRFYRKLVMAENPNKLQDMPARYLERLPHHPEKPEGWAENALLSLPNDPKTQWPPDKFWDEYNENFGLDPKRLGEPISRNEGLRRSGYTPTVDPQLPASQKFKELARGSYEDRTSPPTHVLGSSPNWNEFQGGSWFPGPASMGGLEPYTHIEGRALPLSPLELFLTAMGPTNFEKRIKPPPVR